MIFLKKIEPRDFPSTRPIACIHGAGVYPTATDDNLIFLMERYNDLVDATNEMALSRLRLESRVK